MRFFCQLQNGLAVHKNGLAIAASHNSGSLQASASCLPELPDYAPDGFQGVGHAFMLHAGKQ